MRFRYSTYAFYGVHVPQGQYKTGDLYTETEMLDRVIRDFFPDAPVTYTTAGGYDRDELFLGEFPKDDSCEVRLGTFEVFQPVRPNCGWLLTALIRRVGYQNLANPGLVVVPDLS